MARVVAGLYRRSAARRSRRHALRCRTFGKNTGIIEPLVPVDLVIDHSVQVDFSSTRDAFEKNMEMEFRRNRSRYQFLKWGTQAFDGFLRDPPGIGICHQVNLEYLRRTFGRRTFTFLIHSSALIHDDDQRPRRRRLGRRWN